MKRISTVLIILLCGYAISGQAQITIDSIVMNYLGVTNTSSKPVLRITTKNNKTVRETNFFVEPGDSVVSGSVKITTFIFGFAASHERKYFLLRVTLPSGIEGKIIDAPTVEEGVQGLFTFLKNFTLTNEEKSILIRALTYAYN